MTERASIFGGGETIDFDIADFTPKKPEASKKSAPVETIRAVSEAANFPSREAAPTTVKTQLIEPVRAARRHRTGRNVQLNIKVKPETLDIFYRLADSQGWVLGETLEKALIALKEQLATR